MVANVVGDEVAPTITRREKVGSGLDANGNPVRAAGSDATAVETDESGEPKSKYGFEFTSDDKVVDVVLAAMDKRLDVRFGRLDPLLKDHESAQAAREASTKATQALPRINELYTVSTDKWVTQEMVSTAIQEFPGLPPEKAFAACYPKELAKFFQRHASGEKQTVRNLPANDTGAKTRMDLKEGASFADIVASEATL